MNEARLKRTLDEIGWSSEPHSANTLRVVHDTTVGKLVVFVRLSDNWLIASVVPFLTTRGDNPFELARWLLRMNRDMYQSKFAYDEDGDVVLTVELPTEALDFAEIRAALEGMLASAVEHTATLRAAAEPKPSTDEDEPAVLDEG